MLKKKRFLAAVTAAILTANTLLPVNIYAANSIYNFSYDFENGRNPFKMTGAGAGSSYLKVNESGNNYWRYEASGKAALNYSQLELEQPEDEYTKAVVDFKWWPERNQNSGGSYGFIELSDENGGNLLQFQNSGGGSERNALFFMDSESNKIAIDEEKADFWGGGVSAIEERWYQITVDFDFETHLAAFKITNPEGVSKTFDNINISENSVMISDFRVGWHRVSGTASAGMELTAVDDIIVTYDENLEISKHNFDFEDGTLPTLTKVGGSNSSISINVNKFLHHKVSVKVVHDITATPSQSSVSEEIGWSIIDEDEMVATPSLAERYDDSDIATSCQADKKERVKTATPSQLSERIAKADLKLPSLTKAEFAFKWWPERNREAFSGITFLDNDILLLQLQNCGGDTDKTELKYKNGEESESLIGTVADGFFGAGNMELQERWYDVKIIFDFQNHTADLKVINPELEVFEENGIEIPEEADTADVFTMGWYGTGEPIYECMAIDDFSGKFYLVNDKNIISVSAGNNAFITAYSSEGIDFTQKFPTSVQISTEGGATDTIPLGVWTSNRPVDNKKTGTYIYSAPLNLSGTEYKNPRNLNAEVSVHYIYEEENVENYGFYDDFSKDIWSASSLNGVHNNKTRVAFDSVKNDGNSYMLVTGQNGVPNNRTIGSLNKIISTSYAYESATVTFDMLPVIAADFVEVTLFSSNKANSLFTVAYTNSNELNFFTDGAYSLADGSSTAGFEGNTVRGDAKTLCDTDLNRWCSVRVDLNFGSHFAAIRVYDKESGDVLATATDIPIDPDAINVNRMALAGQIKEIYKMGIDNVGINFEEYDHNSILAIKELPDVSVAKDDYYEYVTEKMPKSVSAIVAGNQNEEVELQLGSWECQPAFDENSFGDYIWTAEILPGEYENTRNLDMIAYLNMEYTAKRYVTSVENPPVVELKPGEELPAFPENVKVKMSNKESSTMPLDVNLWEEINGAVFPDSGERVYIYKTVLMDSEECTNKDNLTAEWRVNYFSTGDNYNGNVRSMEYLDRGVYAVPAKNDSGILISWRLLATEYNSGIEFNIYRNDTIINDTPILDVTNYIDVEGRPGDSYTVESITNGKSVKSDVFIALEDNYISVPLQIPENMPSLNNKFDRPFAGETKPIGYYEPLEGGVADVDGDGQYEMIVKWLPSNSFDPGQGGETSSSSPMMYDCLRMDGTVLWRLNLGYSVPAGSHWSPFIFYDLDEDGLAEFSIITSDGSRMYRPDENGMIDISREDLVIGVIGDPALEGQDMQLNGMPTETTSVYLTTFQGTTGEIIDTIDFPVETGAFEDWGDTTGNRANRYNATVAYIPTDLGDSDCATTIPALCFNRGYYRQTSMSVLTLRDKKLNLEWSDVFASDSIYAHKGNHYNNSGDIDNDGFDEIIIGSMAFDHDGEVLWLKNGENGLSNSGHGDASHLAAMKQGSDQLYYFQPFESGVDTFNYELINASNGAYIGGHYYVNADIGRGVATNITPEPGYEFWAQVPNVELESSTVPGGIYNINGQTISENKPENFVCAWHTYWDGDLLSELPDGKTSGTPGTTHTVYKYNWETNELDVVDTFEGAVTSNGTRNSPVIAADILGDWREEIISRSADFSELRIYCTDIETDYMIYTLMHDPVYRNAVASQNSSYNQPPSVGFYLGEDEEGRARVLNMELPVPNIVYTTDREEWSDNN